MVQFECYRHWNPSVLSISGVGWISLYSLLASWGNKNWTPRMKVKKLGNLDNKICSTGCKWSSLNASGTETPVSIHFWVNPFFFSLWGNNRYRRFAARNTVCFIFRWLTGKPRPAPPWRPCPLYKEMVYYGRLGKTGSNFWNKMILLTCKWSSLNFRGS